MCAWSSCWCYINSSKRKRPHCFGCLSRNYLDTLITLLWALEHSSHCETHFLKLRKCYRENKTERPPPTPPITQLWSPKYGGLHSLCLALSKGSEQRSGVVTCGPVTYGSLQTSLRRSRACLLFHRFEKSITNTQTERTEMENEKVGVVKWVKEEEYEWSRWHAK